MEASLLQQHLDQVRADLRRAQSLFGDSPIPPPAVITPDESVVKLWVR
jgi:hypothetical protein